MVNQRMLPPTFPRYTKIKDRNETYGYLEELSHNLKHACKVISCTNYQMALNFFIEFSKKSGSCLLSRSVLQVLYLPVPNKVFGITNLSDVLKDSVKAFIAPPALMPKNLLYNNPQVKIAFFRSIKIINLFSHSACLFFFLYHHVHTLHRPKNVWIHFSSIMSIRLLCFLRFVALTALDNVIRLHDSWTILPAYKMR